MNRRAARRILAISGGAARGTFPDWPPDLRQRRADRSPLAAIDCAGPAAMRSPPGRR